MTELASGRLARYLTASLFRVGAGFLLAVVIGVPSGLGLAHSLRLGSALLPFINFFRNLSTLASAASIPKVHFQVAQDHGIRGIRLHREVTLPAIAPQLIVGLRMTAGLSWVILVAAEMLATTSSSSR